MINGQNNNVQSGISGLINRAGEKIAGAIKAASEKTGVDFSYLLKQAQVESSFKENAKAKSSSATGLYQFIESTWLQTVNKYGDKHGLGHIADKINDNGQVNNRHAKQQILALRNDPKLCALMAGELAAENKNYLEKKCGNADIGATELYMAHFLGAGGAAKFINAKESNGHANAAALFPAAASANKNIFYTKNGNARSINEVYALFDKKFDLPKDSAAQNVAVAMAPSPVVNNYNNACNVASINYGTNYGAIPALQSPVIMPFDVLAILKDDNNINKYNS